MDDLDRHLLARLGENARAPVAELARALGLSRTTVQSRLARLEKSGVIAGYAVKLREASGESLRGVVMISLEARKAGKTVAALREIAGVRKVMSVSGPFDMIATVEAAGVAEMDAVIDEIGGVKGVERTNSSIVLSTKFDR